VNVFYGRGLGEEAKAIRCELNLCRLLYCIASFEMLPVRLYSIIQVLPVDIIVTSLFRTVKLLSQIPTLSPWPKQSEVER